MHTEPLDALPLWGLLLAVVVALWLVMEWGYRIGRWRRAQTPDEKDQPVGAMVASILALLALMLGFTFSLAASRFEARRQVVLEEANAIGTTYLRARLLPEPQRTELEKLLREYAEVRLQGVQTEKTAQAITRSEEIHELLWAQAAAAADQDPSSIMTGVFVQSLNQLIDLHANRMLLSLRSRIPLVIWVSLFGLAVLGIAAVGYQSGLAATRRSPAMLGLVLAFSLVVYLIADLDRAHEGLLRVGQQAMIDVQTSMQRSGAPPGPTRDKAP